MAYVHASVALARMHGQERDAISLLKTDLNTVLSDEELTRAQTIIRELY